MLAAIMVGLLLALPVLPVYRLSAPVRAVIWHRIGPALPFAGMALFAVWLALSYRPRTPDQRDRDG